jgi:hypothetical protein
VSKRYGVMRCLLWPMDQGESISRDGEIVVVREDDYIELERKLEIAVSEIKDAIPKQQSHFVINELQFALDRINA